MKICLVAHGYPPELVGGTESSVQGLAQALAARGDEVLVVAGTLECADGFRISESMDGPIRVIRLHRGDPYFDHWQKSDSVWASDRLREILSAERPDVLHVHHWIRLSRDLVNAAALEGVPAVVTLHDHWSTCLVTFRVRPDSLEFCRVKLAPDPCLACAQHVPPRTPWLDLGAQTQALQAHRSDVIRELRLARSVIVPSASHALAVREALGLSEAECPLRVVSPGRELSLERAPALAPRSATDPLLLGAWGHLHPLKGQDLMIDALHRMQHKDRVELHLAGGEPEPGFAARVRSLATGLKVTLHGAYRVPELATHAVSRVHAMLSATRADESWGLVIDEAVALGLPSILPRSGAFAERLQEGQGALFYSARDAAALAALLDRVVLEPELLEAARRRLPALAEVAPGVERQVDELRTIYAEAQAAGPPAVREEDSPSGPERAASQARWDAQMGAASAEELGLD